MLNRWCSKGLISILPILGENISIFHAQIGGVLGGFFIYLSNMKANPYYSQFSCRFYMQSVMLPFYYFPFNRMRKFLNVFEVSLSFSVDQLYIPEIKQQKSSCIFLLWKITAYIIFRLGWFSSSIITKSLDWIH